jgi:hypothetical protein
MLAVTRANHIEHLAAATLRRLGKKPLMSMPIRIRKLIGAVALISLVVVWALVAMAVAQAVLASANHVLEALYYVIAGLGWVLPAMPLIAWMSRPDAG